jgi:hypothetical protein
LSDKITQQITREENVTARLESQSRRFVSKFTGHSFYFLCTSFLSCLLLRARNSLQQGR